LIAVELTSFQRWYYGAIGAAAPEVVRFYALAKQTAAPDFPHNVALYLITSAIFSIVGGVFATLWDDDVKSKCFYLGATFPLVMSAIGAGALRL
jgi:hypothetical protein